MKNRWVIGTRGSLLAVTQAELVCSDLQKQNPKFEFVIQKITTTGDIQKNVPIGALNLKGAFTKELDEALLNNKIDFAVHSMKDLPSELPIGLKISCITHCEDPRDVFVSIKFRSLKELPKGGRIGTASARRISQLKKNRGDLQIEFLRGNVNTRLRKLEEGKVDAILLAAAGLFRLKKESLITEYLNPKEFVPAVGQGKLAVVCRLEDKEAHEMLEGMNNAEHYQIALAQRAFMKTLEGGCSIPLGCFAEIQGQKILLIGYLGHPDGQKFVQIQLLEDALKPEKAGELLAKKILEQGGKELLQQIKNK